jgi:hypothetical protein
MSTLSVVILIVVIAAAAVLVFYAWRTERSKRLRSRFGPEYDHAVREYGTCAQAERSLEQRQERVEHIRIRRLSELERDQFAEQWRLVQSTFVDDPAQSIHRADGLVCEVMKLRGYPMAEFDRRAEDLSVDYPRVVRNYRSAHDIAMRTDRNEVSTEDLRQALVYYRDLFDELLEAHTTGPRR